MLYTSMPVLACSLYPPFNRLGMPQANSMFSNPRATSPSASPSTLPCSREMSEAISLRLASTSSRMWNMTSARRERLVARQAGNAAFADSNRMINLRHEEARSTAEACCPSRRIPNNPRPTGGPFKNLARQPNARSDSCCFQLPNY